MAVSKYVAAPLFGALAVVQAVRFVQAWPVSVNGFSVPVWASAIAAVGFATLAILIWREGGARGGS
jgi:hypothetical protein